MAILEERHYREQSRIFLAQAQGESEQGDLRQASEKGWGAAAQTVKAVAESKGWDHRSHRLLNEAVSKLGTETGDPQIRLLFNSASALHANFYEGGMGYTDVSDSLDQVSEFVDKVEALLS